jgi:PAS domain S-box-containing protein
METELSRVVDAILGFVWTALPDGHVDFVNQRWCEYTGLGIDAACGRGWQTAIHPEDLPELLERWRSILASGEAGELEARLRRFDGEYRWFLFRTSPLANASGLVVKWCGLNTDIEDRRRAEEARRARWWLSSPAHENHFRSILDGLPALVTLMTPDGRLEHANRQTLEYFRETLDQVEGSASASTYHPDDRPDALAAWKRSVETGEPYDFEGRQRRADGVYRWFHMRGVPLRDTEGRIVLWCLLQTDIDDLKRAEALLAGEKRLLEMVARDFSLSVVLNALCGLVESTVSGCCCSVLLVDATGTRFLHGAAPSLPSNEPLDGDLVDRQYGPCGMAASLKTQVIASDLASDSRWDASAWPNLVLGLGLRSCWATPILSGDQRVLGVCAIYQREPKNPTPLQQDLIEQFTHIAGISIERAQNDNALKRSEARKAAILDSALDCIVTIDHEGRITEFNPAAERTFGFRRDEVVGERLADVIIPLPLREGHRRGFARYLATGEAQIIGKRLEMTAVRADGSEFPVELTVTRIPFDGAPSFTGYLRDITDRKQSEENLRRSEAYLAEAQELSLTGSFGWDISADEHFWSDETFRIFEYDVSTKITLKMIMERVHPLDIPLIRQAVALASNGLDFDYECRLLMPSDAVKHIHIVAHATRDQDGRQKYIGAVQDVTQRRLSEEALSTARSELARVARITSLGAMTASIAHEVNQPLSGIITNASTCLRMLAADPPNLDGARETARRTIRDGNRASDVIARLRALFSKKDATIESVDLNKVTQEVIALSSSELQRSRVIVRAKLADDLPLVTGDRVQLQQVILNLVLNALDAMSGVDDRPRQLVITTERDEEERVRLTVQDAGVGFETQGAEKLFEPFYTTKSGGMGIGLSVSRSIIERHEGRLWAEPNGGPGATFAFSIPRRPESVNGAHSLRAI